MRREVGLGRVFLSRNDLVSVSERAVERSESRLEEGVDRGAGVWHGEELGQWIWPGLELQQQWVLVSACMGSELKKQLRAMLKAQRNLI